MSFIVAFIGTELRISGAMGNSLLHSFKNSRAEMVCEICFRFLFVIMYRQYQNVCPFDLVATAVMYDNEHDGEGLFSRTRSVGTVKIDRGESTFQIISLNNCQTDMVDGR